MGRVAEAAQIYSETIRVFQESGQRAAVAHELECFAFIALEGGENAHAATLFGAAEALREAMGSSMMLTERREYDQEVSRLRGGMEEDALEAAWTAGRGMSMEEAVEAALQGVEGK
jgi:non-specific serine/threonine protein kinase